MDNRSLAMVWFVGAVVALAIYALDPGSFFQFLAVALDSVQQKLAVAIDLFGARFMDLLRALAIALYFVFLVLSVRAIRLRLRARTALLVVSGMFFILTGSPSDWDRSEPGSYWFAAFVLTGIAAMVMTRRLITASRRHEPVRKAAWDEKIP